MTEKVGKKWGLSVLVLILPCAATFGLGSWQLVRREKKVWIVTMLVHLLFLYSYSQAPHLNIWDTISDSYITEMLAISEVDEPSFRNACH